VVRVAATLAAGAAAGLLAAAAFGVSDLYLSGHAAGTLGGPMLDLAALDLHLSLADVAVLVVAMLAAGVTWTELGGPG
jgi:hypothetical protein